MVSQLRTVFALAVVASINSSAAAQHVRFDVGQLVAGRDISPPQYATNHPGQKLIDVPVRVSTFLSGVSPSELAQIELQIISPRGLAWVADYSPKTTLASDVVGSVKVERGKESSNHLGLNISASYEHWLKAGGLADSGSKRRESIKFEQLPQLEEIAASGLMARGTGVYFKLRNSSQTSLEGEKLYRLQLRVPEQWQAGLLDVTCRATCRQRGLFSSSDDKSQCTASRFLIAVYVQGSRPARQAAERFTQSEQRFYQAARQHQPDIRRRALPTLAHRIGSALDVVQPRIPEDWMTRVLEHPKDNRNVLSRLPEAVRHAVEEYHAARRGLMEQSSAVVAPQNTSAGDAETKDETPKGQSATKTEIAAKVKAPKPATERAVKERVETNAAGVAKRLTDRDERP